MIHDDYICGNVYVYRHKQSGEVFAERHTNALALEDDENYEHIATFNAASIQGHYNRYDSAKEFGMEVAMEMTDNEKLLVAAAYRAAVDAVNEVIPHNKYDDQTYEYLAAVKKLTPADAEKALREFGLEVAMEVYDKFEYSMSNFEVEQIVNEVMKK